MLDVERSEGPKCAQVNGAILNFILSTPSIETVILAGRWALWSEGTRYKREFGNPIFISPASAGKPVSADNHRALSVGLEQTIAKLRAAGKQVWLVGQVPEVGYRVPKSLYVEELLGRTNIDIRPTVAEYKTRQHFVLTLFEKLAKKYSVNIIWPETGTLRR